MNKFVNIQNGCITIDTFRSPQALATSLTDMLKNATEESCLTASIDVDEVAEMLGSEWGQISDSNFQGSLSFEKLDFNASIRFTVEFDADDIMDADDLSNLDWDTAIKAAEISVV